MFPTPRRSLFTTATMIDASEGRGKCIIPLLLVDIRQSGSRD